MWLLWWSCQSEEAKRDTVSGPVLDGSYPGTGPGYTPDSSTTVETTDTGDSVAPEPTIPPTTTDPGLVDVAVPPPPAPSSVVDVVTVVLRTSTNTNAGTDANSLSVCLTATDCFGLDVVGVDDFEDGAVDEFVFEGVALERDAVDRVEIRSENGIDRYEPSCLVVHLDDELAYAADGLEGLYFGNEADNEMASWIDPGGLHVSVPTCHPDVLTHGPMRGWTSGNEARVWARTDGAHLLGLRVSQTADPADGALVAASYAKASDGFSVTLRTDQLEPGRAYTWWLEVDGVPRSEAAFLEAAPDGPAPFTLAMGSCASDDPQEIFDVIEELGPDAFFFLGDNHYANSADLGTLRWFYRWSAALPDRASMLSTVPTVAVWDDHDYVGNNTDAFDPGGEVALRAFTESWANPAFGTEFTPGVFFEARWGDVALFGLDDRLYRGTDGVIGLAQEDWLVEAVLESDAVFKVIASGSQWTLLGSTDSWAEFPDQRQRLFERLAGVPGIVLLSGDVHKSELRLLPDPGVGYDVPELTSSPLANEPPATCGVDAEQIACFDSTNSFVLAHFTFDGPEPELVAEIRDDAGVVVASWRVGLSALGG